MRLVDADMLNFENQHYNKSQMKAILDFIDNQPTAYDVDKAVEQLEKAKDIPQDDSMAETVSTRIWNKALEKAIEIVKAGKING